MARLSRVVTLGVSLAAVGATALSLGAPAQADPASPTTYRLYAGVGSDTTQDVLNALAGDVPGVTGVFTKVASYNAFADTGSIRTKSGGPEFTRPAGSGAGVKALSDALTGTPYNGVDITGQVQFARSSSGPAASGTDLTYVPFGRDAVSYAYTGAAAKVGKLTTAQLTKIYSNNGPVTINGVKITGVLPQSSSGTRKFFLAAIGVTTIGSSVVQTSSPENDGSILTGDNQIVPFSAAQWIGQKNGLSTDTTGSAALGTPNAKPVVKLDTTTNKLIPYPAFYNAAPFGRYVYNVIPTSSIGKSGSVATAFVGATSGPCKAAGQAIVKQFGFAAIASTASVKCGATSITGAYTP